MRQFSLPMALVLLLAPFPAFAEERNTAPATSITLDENGLPIVSVTLHSLKTPNVARTFRFEVDTGSGWCVVDQSVPSELFWGENQIEATARDVANQAIESSTLLLKRVEVGGVTRDGIIAHRMDLRNLLGRAQDQPVDRILGMSFLWGTRFLPDSKGGRFIWWGEHFRPGVTLPMMEESGSVPRLALRLGALETSAVLDTGMGGGVDLPSQLRPKGSGEAIFTTGLTGTQIAGSEMIVEWLDAGSASWSQVPVTFQPEETGGRIGADVWNSAPVCFDFITNHLTFTTDRAGHLPISREPSRKLPIVWDRSGLAPRLVVLLVKSGSAMEKAGCKAGDELIQVGDLPGQALSRRSVQDLVASGVKHTWVVRRNGKEVPLTFNAE